MEGVRCCDLCYVFTPGSMNRARLVAEKAFELNTKLNEGFWWLTWHEGPKRDSKEKGGGLAPWRSHGCGPLGERG